LGSGFKWVEPVGCEVVLIWFGLRNQLIWCGLVTVSGGVGWSGLINCVCYIWMELDPIWFPAHLQADSHSPVASLLPPPPHSPRLPSPRRRIDASAPPPPPPIQLHSRRTDDLSIKQRPSSPRSRGRRAVQSPEGGAVQDPPRRCSGGARKRRPPC
jgi:hypothetical protein